MGAEECRVVLVEHLEVGHVGQEDGALDDLVIETNRDSKRWKPIVQSERVDLKSRGSLRLPLLIARATHPVDLATRPLNNALQVLENLLNFSLEAALDLFEVLVDPDLSAASPTRPRASVTPVQQCKLGHYTVTCHT